MGADESVTAWKTAYRHYGKASAQSLRLPEGDPARSEQMANTSWAVAAAWRQIAQAGLVAVVDLGGRGVGGTGVRGSGTRMGRADQRNRPPSEGTW